MSTRKYQIGDSIRLDYGSANLQDVIYPNRISGSYAAIVSGFYDESDKVYYYRVRFKKEKSEMTTDLDLTERQLDFISLKPQPHPFTQLFK